MNGTNLEDADHLEAVEALRNTGNEINIVVLREVFIAPENPPIPSPSEPEEPVFDGPVRVMNKV